MKPNYLMQIAVLLASGCIASSAIAQWVWLDEHGVKQFSDIAPPSNIPKNHILKTPRGASTAAPQPDNSADKSADAGADSAAAKMPMSQTDKEADYKKRKLEQAEKDKKAADEAKRKQAAEENCTHAKAYLDELKSGVRITGTDSNGERTYMGDDERTREIARAQDMLDGCNK